MGAEYTFISTNTSDSLTQETDSITAYSSDSVTQATNFTSASQSESTTLFIESTFSDIAQWIEMTIILPGLVTNSMVIYILNKRTIGSEYTIYIYILV